ncbi:MAG: PIN domain-containing protein [Synergistaceae bacterium]|nr:PIN domain-containing protein [Synergistaceae bacterium]
MNDLIAFKAAEIRSCYEAFKQMDALQLATAIVSGANVFYTNDEQLLQFREIAVSPFERA